MKLLLAALLLLSCDTKEDYTYRSHLGVVISQIGGSFLGITEYHDTVHHTFCYVIDGKISCIAEVAPIAPLKWGEK